MPKINNRITYIRRYMEEQTDEMHPVTIADIRTRLKAKDIESSRQTIARDIQQLLDTGTDVVCNHGKPNHYFIGDRVFELPELKMLVDAVTAWRLIPPKKADVLIRKVSGFASVHQAGELRRSLCTIRQARPVDDKAYITVDLIYTAINTERKITCRYYDWNINKEKVYKHKHSYVFSPYGLAWSNDRYYAVGWSDSHEKIITLRVDRIANPILTEYAAAPKPDGFTMSYYGERVINMYDGELRNVILRCENAMMKHIIDRFGESVATEVISAEKFVTRVCVPTSPTFFAWVFTFGGAIRITAPDDVVNSYHDMLTKAMH